MKLVDFVLQGYMLMNHPSMLCINVILCFIGMILFILKCTEDRKINIFTSEFYY